MRSRFAPSPTGDLHLGGAYIALAAFLRAGAGPFVMRVEDLDPPRVVPGATERILDDLRWLGLTWDEQYAQSERASIYDEAIERLGDLVYPCTCTRAEIARAASAPHAGEEGPRYPGTCRDPRNRRSDRPAALRLRVPSGAVTFHDELHGAITEDVEQTVGDFVLRRADGVASYQLAVIVDDLAMRIDEVVRGDDLLPSTARQVLLARLLGGSAPRFLHLPLVLGPDGERLAKRHQSRFVGSTVRELRERGVTAGEILGALGHALSLIERDEPTDLPTLRRAACERPPLRRTPWVVPARWVRARPQ
jgi:glutamyl-tRNA synthetase